MNILRKFESALQNPITKAILEHHGVVSTDDLQGVAKGEYLHDYMVEGDCLVTNDGELIFFGFQRQREKFLYYMGAEKEACLVSLFDDMAIYSEVDECRYEHCLTAIADLATV